MDKKTMSENKKIQVNKPEKLADKIHVPSSRLMVLLPVLGIASMGALITVIILGILMLESLSGNTNTTPDRIFEITDQLEKLSEKMDNLEKKLDSLKKQVNRVNTLANELYFERPSTEEEKEKARLSQMAPAELLRLGLEAITVKNGRPVVYFESIIDNYPNSNEVVTAIFQLGMIKARNADYEEAIVLLKKYIEEYSRTNPTEMAKANFYIGLSFHSTGKKTDAIKYYEKAGSMLQQQDILRATCLSNLIELHVQLKNRKEAVKYFDILKEDFKNDSRTSNMIKRAHSIVENLNK